MGSLQNAMLFLKTKALGKLLKRRTVQFLNTSGIIQSMAIAIQKFTLWISQIDSEKVRTALPEVYPQHPTDKA